MKKALGLFAMLAIMLTGCSNESEKTLNGTGNIRFDVLNYEQVSLDEVTRASAATALAHLEMAIYDASSLEIVDSVKTVKGSEGYGSFSATLPFGDYIIVFLGFDGSKASSLKQIQNIGFSDAYVPNFFYKTLPLTVSPSSTGSQEITLSRAVSAFSIKTQGYIPNNLKNITIVANGGGYRFNAQTGLATSISQRTSTFDVSSYAGTESVGITIYAFLPSNETAMSFNITATDTNDDILAEKVFSNVPMRINQRTIYTGSLFGDGTETQGFNLTLENDVWNDINYTY